MTELSLHGPKAEPAEPTLSPYSCALYRSTGSGICFLLRQTEAPWYLAPTRTPADTQCQEPLFRRCSLLEMAGHAPSQLDVSWCSKRTMGPAERSTASMRRSSSAAGGLLPSTERSLLWVTPRASSLALNPMRVGYGSTTSAAPVEGRWPAAQRTGQRASSPYWRSCCQRCSAEDSCRGRSTSGPSGNAVGAP